MKKAEIRKIVLAQRTELTEKEFRERSQRVIETLTSLLTPGKTIASFKAIPYRNEISLDSLEGNFAFPRVISAAEGTMEMVLAAEFANSDWGIPEPVGGSVVKSTDFDIILIPLLAFDKKGQRVGYGKGFYDRYLALCRPGCLKIGISLFEPVDLIEEVESHDIPLNIAICPAKLYDFR
jgi:5-formyltetrahydrofolate cyclo-ligase